MEVPRVNHLKSHCPPPPPDAGNLGGVGLLHERCSEPTMSTVVAMIQESQRNPSFVGVKSKRVVSGPAKPFQRPCSQMGPPVVRGWVAPFFSPGTNSEFLFVAMASSKRVLPVTIGRWGCPGPIGGILGPKWHHQLPLGVSERSGRARRHFGASPPLPHSPLCRWEKGDSGRRVTCSGSHGALVSEHAHGSHNFSF